MKAMKLTPRKTSVDASANKYHEKLRSNSSFKKQKTRPVEYSPSPTAFRDRSASKPTTVNSRQGLPMFGKFDFAPLVRKSTKTSDTTGGKSSKFLIEEDTEDFFSCLAKSTKPPTIDRFDSKATLSIGKSNTV